MSEKSTLLLLQHLTYKEAESVVKYIIREQEKGRKETCQARIIDESELDATCSDFHTMRVYGIKMQAELDELKARVRWAYCAAQEK